MTPTLAEIRAALRILAQRKGRPDYELCTVKEVKHALSNGLEHHLIAELPFFEIKREEDKSIEKNPVVTRVYPDEVQALELIIWLKRFNGLYKDLAQMIGCDCSILTNIKAGRRKVTLAMYNRLTKAREELESVTERDGEGR